MLTKCVISPASLKIFMAFPRSNGEYSCPRLQRFAASVCVRERETERRGKVSKKEGFGGIEYLWFP
jgi:hypothetical protein